MNIITFHVCIHDQALSGLKRMFAKLVWTKNLIPSKITLTALMVKCSSSSTHARFVWITWLRGKLDYYYDYYTMAARSAPPRPSHPPPRHLRVKISQNRLARPVGSKWLKTTWMFRGSWAYHQRMETYHKTQSEHRIRRRKEIKRNYAFNLVHLIRSWIIPESFYYIRKSINGL